MSEECDNLPDILESLCSAADFWTQCCLSCNFGYSITRPDCFPKSFCLWCCVSDPSHGFSPLHIQTGHFLLSCRVLIANMPKGWNKLANQFTNTVSLLQPQRHLVFIIIFLYIKIPILLVWVRLNLLFLQAYYSFCWSTTRHIPAEFSVSGITGCCVVYLFFGCDLSVSLPTPLLFLSFSHRFAEPWAMHAVQICFSSLSIIPPCLR